MASAAALLVVALLISIGLRFKKDAKMEILVHQCVFWGLGLGAGLVWFLAFFVIVAMRRQKFVIAVLASVVLVGVYQMEVAVAWWQGASATPSLLFRAINAISALF